LSAADIEPGLLTVAGRMLMTASSVGFVTWSGRTAVMEVTPSGE
jgi:hypothetical protein